MTQQPLNILVLYDDAWTHVESTREHLEALRQRSRHNYMFLPAQETVDRQPGQRMFDDYAEGWPPVFDLDLYDAVIWHFVLPAYKIADRWTSDYIARAVADRLAQYSGLKVLFAQDEYDSTAMTREAIRRAGITVVMTSLPPEAVPYAYPAAQLPGVEFIQTLAGYVPDDVDLTPYAQPMAERDVRLAYRARTLPHRYGSLGREKLQIGVRMSEEARARGVRADIAWTEDKRIYGEDWYRFLGSARAMLATESGSYVFDFDGSLHAEEAAAQAMTYEAYHAARIAGRELHVNMGQTSPKVFEAISLRTALVCFEGHYSGVIRPDEHYIALKKDYSNADDVFARLEDVAGLQAMTERAYRDVICSGRWSYASFVQSFDAVVEARTALRPKVEIISAPILIRLRGDAAFHPVVRDHPFEYILNSGVLYGDFLRRDLEATMARVREAEFSITRMQTETPPDDAVTTFHAGPDLVRCYDVWRDAGAEVALDDAAATIRTPASAWVYGAGVHLDYPGIDFEQQHVWLQVRTARAGGNVRAALYESGRDAIHGQATIAAADGPGDIFIRVFDAAADLLIFRTGPDDRPGEVVVRDVCLITASRYTPKALAAAQALAALPPDRRPWPQPEGPIDPVETMNMDAPDLAVEPATPLPIEPGPGLLLRLLRRLGGRSRH